MFIDNPEIGKIDPHVRKSAEDTALLLAEMGHEIEEIPYPFGANDGDKFILYYGMLAWVLITTGPLVYGKDFTEEALETITRGLRDKFTANLWNIPALFMTFYNHVKNEERVFQQYDVLMSPSLGMLPPEQDYIAHHLEFEEMMSRMRRFAGYTPAQNVSGAPAINLPLGFDNDMNLPIGMQFSAPTGHERRILELAYELEEASHWKSTYQR